MDLVSAWMLLPPPARAVLREVAGVDGATWARGRGWVVTLGVAFVAPSVDNELVRAIGARGIEAVLAERAGG